MTMKFNGQQREGIARVLDNYFFVSTVTIATHVFGRLSLNYFEILMLLILTIVLPIASLTLRKE